MNKMANDTLKSDKLRPFEELGFTWTKKAGAEVFGECVFCGKKDKLYINSHTGLWECKVCGLKGNIHEFLLEWWKTLKTLNDSGKYDELWTVLEYDRGISRAVLESHLIVYDPDGRRWVVPVMNDNSTFLTFRFFKKDKGTISLAGTETFIWGMQRMKNVKEGSTIFICEGEWDGIALYDLLDSNGIDGVVLAVPGANIFKIGWIKYFQNQNVVLCYDHDKPGQDGVARTASKIGATVKSLHYILWPDELPAKFDLRDFYKSHGTVEVFQDMIVEYASPDEKEAEAKKKTPKPLLSSGKRPPFKKVLEVYRKWLHMTEEMEDALRIIYATIYSNQLQGDPLWVHIAGPPGSGKTELLMSISEVTDVVVRSTVTPQTLVSGFQGAGGKDPSLIPHLMGKTFVLKDFTEILQMQRNQKDDVYHILRGAYDGEVSRSYGNGVIRHYKGYFSMISGVTQAIFGEHGTSLGERFLTYHIVGGVGASADEMIMAAIGNSGDEAQMKAEIAEAAKSFLEYEVDEASVPQIEIEYKHRLIALAQVVGILRADVPRDFSKERMLYRPQYEVGTRLAKQLSKLMNGLILLENPMEVNENIYRLVARVALNTCVGFNLEIIQFLSRKPGSTILEFQEHSNIPFTTCREQMEDMTQLGALVKGKIPNPAGRGGPIGVYSLSPEMEKQWRRAGLEVSETIAIPTPRVRMRFRKTRSQEDE